MEPDRTSVSELGETTVLGRGMRAAEMPRFAVALRWGVGLAGTLTLAGLLLRFSPVSLPHFLVFASSMALLESVFSVRAATGSHFTLAPTFLLVYFATSGGVAAACLVGAVRIVSWLLQRLAEERRQTALFVFFDVGQHVLATLIAAGSVQWVLESEMLLVSSGVRPHASVAFFAAFYLVATAAFTSGAVYSRFGFSDVRTQLWPTATFWMAFSLAVSVPLAIIMMLLARVIGYALSAGVIFVLLATISLILRLNVDLRKSNQELKAINRIGNLISATLDSEELFRIFARESRKVIPWDVFSIALRSFGSEEVERVFLDLEGHELARRSTPQGVGLTGASIDRGELVTWDRSGGEESPDESDIVLSERTPKSIAVAPLKFGSRVMGAISIQSHQVESYGRRQLRLLETFAGQAAIAVRNAQLFESEERARQERNEFLSLVTHEIKNPLTSIKGYAEMLGHGVWAEDLSGAEEAVRVIGGETERILRLADDLLDASRMSAGRFSVELGDVDLVEILSAVVQRYSRRASQTIQLDLEQRPPRLRADAARLTQVFENLVSNAVKYSSPEGRITVRVSLRGDSVQVSVADQGEGIPPDQLPLIFERFYRIQEGDALVKGTGLGLFITRQIVQTHGGTIGAESTLGEGSRFIVSLPLRGAEPY